MKLEVGDEDQTNQGEAQMTKKNGTPRLLVKDMTPEQKAERLERKRYLSMLSMRRQRAKKRELSIPDASNDPVRKLAHHAYEAFRAKALKMGFLPPTNCIGCGEPDDHLVAHHHKGYARAYWLVVVHLCHKCHMITHRCCSLISIEDLQAMNGFIPKVGDGSDWVPGTLAAVFAAEEV